MDPDKSVCVSLLDFFGFLWIWIIDIIKVYTGRPFCNLRLLNRLKIVLKRKIRSQTVRAPVTYYNKNATQLCAAFLENLLL